MDPGEYWVWVEGKGYFIRFESHGSAPRWFTHREMRKGYCFKSVADARHVADQIGRYGRVAKVIKERPSPPPPPPPPPSPPLGWPPEHLRPWVERILEAGRDTSWKAGYKVLARRHHPDVGGSTKDMQTLSEAFTWLSAQTEISFDLLYPDSVIRDFTDDDIPF